MQTLLAKDAIILKELHLGPFKQCPSNVEAHMSMPEYNFELLIKYTSVIFTHWQLHNIIATDIHRDPNGSSRIRGVMPSEKVKHNYKLSNLDL